MKLKREQLGIAGLKDKEGVTKQRISISKKNLKNC
jgi:tRNA pseudouridine synthase D (truD)